MRPWNEDEVGALMAELGADSSGGINPDRAQLRSLLQSDDEGPFQFVNLLAYRDEAVYPDGHELASAGLSGAEAYSCYGVMALDHVTRRGGMLTFYNDVLQVLVGPAAPWNEIAVMQYPTVEAFVDMIRDPGYQAALVHRDAGLAETVVLVTRSLVPG